MKRKRKWVSVTAPDGTDMGVMTLSNFCRKTGVEYSLAWTNSNAGRPAMGYTLTPAEEPEITPEEQPADEPEESAPVASLSETAREAREHGMSYGQMVAAEYMAAQKHKEEEEPKIMEEGKVLVFEEVPVEETEQEEKREEINMTLHDLVCRLAAPCEISVRRDVGLPDAWEEVFFAPSPSSVWKVAEIAGWQVMSFAPSKELGGLDVYVR